MNSFKMVKIFSVALLFVFSSMSFAKDELVQMDEAYQKVSLDSYIKSQRPDKKDGKSILPIKRVTFDAILMSRPEAKEFQYIYLALELMRVDPLPVIKHQAFVQAEDGKVISVYLEEKFAMGLENHINLGTIKIGDSLNFKGYHSYNYKRGPAMVMEGLFDKRKDKLVEEPAIKQKSGEKESKLVDVGDVKEN